MAARRGPRSLPLTLKGPLGAIGYKDRGVFDEKLALQDEYRFNGVKGGLAWKGKTERYFIGRAPILKEILDWAEECDLDVISVEKLQMAVGGHLTEEQLLNVNAAIWGFLSGAVSGTAETIFKRADTLNGIDAWRRLVRYVDHGKEIRLETLRREVKMLHMKPISSLDKVEEGVAEWENTMNEYILAGGTPYQDAQSGSLGGPPRGAPGVAALAVHQGGGELRELQGPCHHPVVEDPHESPEASSPRG